MGIEPCHSLEEVNPATDRATPRSVSCHFGDRFPVVGLYKFSDGCVCFPDDNWQWLCAQHAYSSMPYGSMELIEGPGLSIFK